MIPYPEFNTQGSSDQEQLIGQEILEHYAYRGQVMRVLFTAQAAPLDAGATAPLPFGTSNAHRITLF